MPLYSTLIILSGYTFGAWTGAVLSYFASLAGAVVVFSMSRTFLRQQISRWLSCTVTIQRVVRVVEKRPQLLFLIRLAPTRTTLTFRTYFMCTALSLFKLIIHTTIGASIHSFAEYHVKPGAHDSDSENNLGRYSSIAGIALCVGVFVYISVITRRAVNEELEDDDAMVDGEERIAFLSGAGASTDDLEAQMVERPTSPLPVTSQ
ncbi:uncharacterized protein B0H18DRAFT_967072 [Fomitopsis serialis]|uniref:uncharacterized protein n=1 Tax=Fomitopsis serialis TaxID=139415 RepID=UPI002008BDAE|nr:uncharacterized protein B0H18DRAFT_967072 [Neoantrodia serialis]KAH9938418.1 hypothetical protein B0H18DRAFT_967072 [Neoantrodia serialis]